MSEEERLSQQQVLPPVIPGEQDFKKIQDRQIRRNKLQQLILRRDVLSGQKEALSKRVDTIHQVCTRYINYYIINFISHYNHIRIITMQISYNIIFII